MSAKYRLAFFVALALAIATATSGGRAADPDKAITIEYLTAVRKSVEKTANLVESLQEDIVEERVGEKEKTLFRLADQTQNELDLLDRTLTGKNPTRALYKQGDRVDAKIIALVKGISELSPKRPALVRVVERIRVQSDDLHFVLSAGDETKERQRQVLVRQAKSLKSAAKLFAVSAEYALLDSPGRAPFLDSAKKLAEKCESFEKLAADSELDVCKKEFSILTEVWAQVVQGFFKLSPKDDFHIARQGFRLDECHRRLFELLKTPGKRPIFVMKL
ncbi:hypothetical protein BH11PLA2_BH11PLA2_30960 [soil metagenome]